MSKKSRHEQSSYPTAVVVNDAYYYTCICDTKIMYSRYCYIAACTCLHHIIIVYSIIIIGVPIRIHYHHVTTGVGKTIILLRTLYLYIMRKMVSR